MCACMYVCVCVCVCVFMRAQCLVRCPVPASWSFSGNRSKKVSPGERWCWTRHACMRDFANMQRLNDCRSCNVVKIVCA